MRKPVSLPARTIPPPSLAPAATRAALGAGTDATMSLAFDRHALGWRDDVPQSTSRNGRRSGTRLMAHLIKELHEDKVFEIIRDDIIRGKYAFGDKLEVQKLANFFGVSRSPVTQAIDRLAHEGLVVIKPHVGSFVVDPTEHDVREIVQLRTALELCALDLAFSNPDLSFLERMQDAVDKVDYADIGADPEVFFASDRVFHDVLFVAAGNQRLHSTYTALRGQIEVFRIGSFSRDAALQSNAYHKRIVTAMKRRDMYRARKELSDHISVTGIFALEVLERKAQPKEGDA